jgi:hypothetical protein
MRVSESGQSAGWPERPSGTAAEPAQKEPREEHAGTVPLFPHAWQRLTAKVVLAGAFLGGVVVPAMRAQESGSADQKQSLLDKAGKVKDDVSNSPPLRERTHELVDGWELKFQPVHEDVDPDSGGLLRFETRTMLGRTTLEHKGHVGRWTTDAGVRGGFLVQENVGLGGYHPSGYVDAEHQPFIGPQFSTFERMTRPLDHAQPSLVVHGWSLIAKSDQGVQVATGVGETQPFYSAMTGVMKRIPLKFFGHHELSVSLGPSVSGDAGRPVHGGFSIDVGVH